MGTFSSMEGETLFKLLEKHHDKKVGYLVYRCTYSDNEKWSRFMQRLTAHVTVELEEPDVDDGCELIRDCWAWDIREDPAKLDGASKADVCRQFNEWVSSVNGNTSLTKYLCCIYADDEVVESILNAPEPDSVESVLPGAPTPFVKLVHRRFIEISEMPPPSEQDFKEANVLGGYDPVDGCIRWDVGWQNVCARDLLPCLYASVCQDCWEENYVRPPRINAM